MKEVTLKELKTMLRKIFKRDYLVLPSLSIDTESNGLSRNTTVFIGDKASFNFIEEINPNGTININFTLYDVQNDIEVNIAKAIREFGIDMMYQIVGVLILRDSSRDEELKKQVLAILTILIETF